VWVSVDKLDKSWKLDPCYLSPAVAKNAYRYRRFGEWIACRSGEVHMSHVHLDGDAIGFTDGRHRFAWFRDHGVRFLPITTSPDEASEIKRFFGTKSRNSVLP